MIYILIFKILLSLRSIQFSLFTSKLQNILPWQLNIEGKWYSINFFLQTWIEYTGCFNRQFQFSNPTNSTIFKDIEVLWIANDRWKSAKYKKRKFSHLFKHLYNIHFWLEPFGFFTSGGLQRPKWIKWNLNNPWAEDDWISLAF